MEATCLPSKGVRLDTVVEEALDDLLVVSVTIAGRVFRGILFDTEKRFGQTNDSPIGIGVGNASTPRSTHGRSLSAATQRTASSVGQSTRQASTCHSGRPVASEYPVATFSSASAVASESQIGGKRKADSSTSKHDSPAGKRCLASTMNNGRRDWSHVRGGQHEGNASETSSDKDQCCESLSDSFSPRFTSAGHGTATPDKTDVCVSSDSDEENGFVARAPAAPCGGVRLRGMARRGRLSHNANRHLRAEDLANDQPQPKPVLVSKPRVPDTPPKARGVRLRGGGRARGSSSHRGHVNGRSEQLVPSAAAKPVSNGPTATGVRLRGGAARRLTSQGRHHSVSPSADDCVPAKDISSTFYNGSSAQVQIDVKSRNENVAAPPGATSSAGVRLRGRGVRRYGIGRGVCRNPSSQSSHDLVLSSSDLDDNPDDTVSAASLSASKTSQKVLSRLERSSLSATVKIQDAEEGTRNSNGAGAGQSKMAASHAESSSFRCQVSADMDSYNSPVTVQVDDNSPLSRSAAANLVAHGSLSLKASPKQALYAPASRHGSLSLKSSPKQALYAPASRSSPSRPSPTSDLDMPLSPVLSFHKNAFKKGDVVWAKMVDSPWWPAVVESIRSSNASPAAMQDLSLLFLGRKGSTQTSLLPTTLVAPFAASFKAKFLPKKRTSTYVRAIQEACDMCGVEAPPVPLPPQRKQPALSGVETSDSDTKYHESTTTAITSPDSPAAHDSVIGKGHNTTASDGATSEDQFVSTVTQQSGCSGEDTSEVLMSAGQAMFATEDLSATDSRYTGVAKGDSLESVLSLQTHPPASPFRDSSPNGSF